MKVLIKIIAVMFVFSAINANAVSNVNSMEGFMSVLQSGSPMAITEAFKNLQFSGITDTKLFDLLEDRLKKTVPTDGSKLALNDAYELIIALASSGNKKYIPALQKIVDDSSSYRKVEYKAKQAINLIPKYNEINKKLSNRSLYSKALSDEENRLVIMLKSDEYGLMGIAAQLINDKRLFYYRLMDELAVALEKHYKKDIDNATYAEAMGHMVKTLATSTDKKYAQLVTDVAYGAANDKVKGYGKHAEGYYR